jgi:hypothetical protein
MGTTLGVTREVDFEGSAFSATTGYNGIGYWIGGMANGPASTNFSVQPDRDRFLAVAMTYNGATKRHFYTIRGHTRKIRTAISNETQYAGYRLGESMKGVIGGMAGVDSKQPWGFNIEGLELSPANDSMYIGLRAPLVPAPATGLPIDDSSRGQLALILPLLNYNQVTDAQNDTTQPLFGPAIQLNLGGRGIRSIYKIGANQYHILAGLATTSNWKPGDFSIFSWNGIPSSLPVELTADLVGRNPESIVGPFVDEWGQSTMHLVEDNGAMDWYGEGGENKDYPFPLWSNLRKSRQVKIILGTPINGTYLVSGRKPRVF